MPNAFARAVTIRRPAAGSVVAAIAPTTTRTITTGTRWRVRLGVSD